ncbi:hypothetical protein MFIFM68171_04175 [Madurella fahalii]|uniref:Uncharacterized protein n=1 Tax=Madurella fahalii TaxID=1157608 RepID=A0ABQ0G8R3_9PEZI
MQNPTKHHPSIEDMASGKPASATAILSGVGVEASFKTPRPDTLSYPEIADEEAALDQFTETPVVSRKLRQQPVPVERPSPKLPRRPSRRKGRGSVGRQQRSPPRCNGAGSNRRLPRSQTRLLHPLGMNPTRLSTSTSMPLAKATKHLEVCSHNPGIVDAGVNEKINTMLAATKALKPRAETATIPLSSTTSRVSQLVRHNGLFKKVSNALTGRTHSKNAARHSSVYHGPNLPDLPGHRNPFLPPLYLPEQAAHIPETELRRNESMNVNRDKIHRVLGDTDQLARLPWRAMSFPGNKPVEDPFTGPSQAAQPLTEFENRLRSNSAEGSLIKPLDHDPFESERILRSSVDSLLPSPPIASSTPRGKRAHPGIADVSPMRQPQVQVGGNHQSKVPGNSSNYENFFRNCLARRQTSPFADALDKRESVRSCHLKLDPVFSYVPVMDSAYRKKHPSPAKHDLEILMRDFRTHFPEIPLGPAAKHDEMDRLSPGPVTAPDAAIGSPHGDRQARVSRSLTEDRVITNGFASCIDANEPHMSSSYSRSSLGYQEVY